MKRETREKEMGAWYRQRCFESCTAVEFIHWDCADEPDYIRLDTMSKIREENTTTRGVILMLYVRSRVNAAVSTHQDFLYLCRHMK